MGISGGLNLYTFCENDPVNYTDPSGLAVVKNRTNRPIIVKGGIGAGKGHTQYGPKEYYSVVLPGETAGGIFHPLVVSDFNTAKKFASKGISMVQDLSLSNSIFDLMPSFSLYDIDYYYDNGKWKKIKGNDWGFIYDIADKNGGLSDTINCFSVNPVIIVNPLITVLREYYLEEHSTINYKRYLHP
ncbi:MAG: hypothetical protein IJU47_01240 [Verrucomicrobia bacterium]|nr:hypothetical protein [Verrucomicrobiota bacterium]